METISEKIIALINARWPFLLRNENAVYDNPAIWLAPILDISKFEAIGKLDRNQWSSLDVALIAEFFGVTTEYLIGCVECHKRNNPKIKNP